MGWPRSREWRRQCHPTPVLLAGKSHGWRSLVGLQSMGSLRVGHDWAMSLSLFTFHFHALEKEMATHSSVLAWRILGTEGPGGLLSMGSQRVRHDWSDLAAVGNVFRETNMNSYIMHGICFSVCGFTVVSLVP